MPTMAWNFPRLFAILAFAGTCLCNPDTIEQRLRSHLMDNYDKSSQPPANLTKVAMRFTVRHVSLTWRDLRLSWSDVTATHVSKLSFDYGTIWQPDVVLYNNAEPDTTGVRPPTKLLVFPSGEVLYVYPTRLRVPCTADLTYWPYDVHNCSAKYGSWVHDGLAYDLELQDDTPEVEVEVELTETYQEDRNLTRGQWSILGSSLQKSVTYYKCCDEPYPSITLRLIIKRNAPAFAYTIQIPAIVLSLLTGAVFLLPPGAVEKVIMGTLCVILDLQFLAYSAATLSYSQSHTPLIVKFVSEQLVLTGIAVVLSAIVVRLVRDPHQNALPRCFQRALAVFATCCCLGGYRHLASKSEMSPYPQGFKGEDLELGEERDFIGRSYPNGIMPGTPNSGNNNTKNSSRRGPYDYLLLGAVIDRICLILYLIVLVGNLINFSKVFFKH